MIVGFQNTEEEEEGEEEELAAHLSKRKQKEQVGANLVRQETHRNLFFLSTSSEMFEKLVLTAKLSPPPVNKRSLTDNFEPASQKRCYSFEEKRGKKYISNRQFLL